MNPAGGVRYHWRAFRHSKDLWQPFRWALGEWLLNWKPSERTLLLVGPSGGYCIQPFLFERFERVVCLEPDPVARWVFAHRLAKAPLERRPKLEFIAQDHLVREPERLPRLLHELGDAALLFSNVIGQLRVLVDTDDPEAPELQRIRAAVKESIAGRSWASFHDRCSGLLEPQFQQPLWADTRLSDNEVLEGLYAEAPHSGSQVEAELLDHLTHGIFPSALPHSYFVWQLEPSVFHVIEAVGQPSPTPNPGEEQASEEQDISLDPAFSERRQQGERRGES